MSFWKKLFGLGGGGGAAAAPTKELEHEGYLIVAAPFKDGSDFLTAGYIRKEVDGEMKEHHFIRADRFPSPDLAADFALAKGRQIIDHRGERLFDEKVG